MAFWMLIKLDLITDNKLLNLTISCTKTVFIDWLYSVGYRLKADSVSKFLGNLPKMSAATVLISSSGDDWPPPVARALKQLQT